MSQRLFVTIASRESKERVLLELPADQPLQAMQSDLVQVLGWKELSAHSAGDFRLETEDGQAMPMNQSLLEAGVSSSDLLYLVAVPKEADGGKSAAKAGGSSDAPESLTAKLLSQPHFEGPSGFILLLGEPPILIGRGGKGIKPDINLSEWDPKVLASRRHAVLQKSKNDYLLLPEKTTNGTFLNGVEMPASQAAVLHDGDRIQFGFQGLELIFRAPKG